LDQSALACEHFRGKFAAVLACHRALDAFHDRGDRTSVVLELLRAVLNGDAGALTDVFVVGTFIGILKASPAADVINQYGIEISGAGLDIADELFQRISSPLPTSIEASLVYGIVCGICLWDGHTWCG
jgi:hypothetical protein